MHSSVLLAVVESTRTATSHYVMQYIERVVQGFFSFVYINLSGEYMGYSYVTIADY